MEKAIRIEETQIAGLHPSAAVDLDRPILGEVAVAVVVEAADFDRSRFSRRQQFSLAAHDAKLVVWHRFADGAQAPLFAGIGGDPADLAAAVALTDADAETLLETLPFLDQERRRAGRDETQRRNVGRVCFLVVVEQHVDRGWIAGGDRRAVFLD